MTHVLIVEDEESIAEALTFLLRREGFEVSTAGDGAAAMDALAVSMPDLILLDLMLPGRSGLEICREIRRTSGVPIIIVTARDQEVDKVVGLEVGADDYVTKPFSSPELVARIRAVLRRNASRPAATPDPSVIEAGPVTLDTDRHVVTVRGQVVALPLKEFALLEVLVRNQGIVLTRERLMEAVWGPTHGDDTRTLNVHIKRLRARIELDRTDPQHILTVRGLGYRFAP